MVQRVKRRETLYSRGRCGDGGEKRREFEMEGGRKKSAKLKFKCEGVKAQTLP